MYLRYQKGSKHGEQHKNKAKQESYKNQRRPLKNENLPLILSSSESLLEDFIELESQVRYHIKIEASVYGELTLT